MFTKERYGGNMSKTVEEIIINSEGIYVRENKNHIEVLDLEEQNNEKSDEASQVLSKYNLDNVNYKFDMKIAQTLTKDEEQLIDYLETCRRSNYSKEKINIPESIPKIEYDLTELKNWFSNIEDKDLRKYKQIEIYKQAKETEKTLNGKVKIKMNIIDKAYFTVQEFLQNRDKKQLAIGEGIRQAQTKQKQANRRNKWYNPEYTLKTNEVSEQFKYEANKDKITKEREYEKIEN